MDSPRRARPARRSRHRLGRPSVKPLRAASLCRLRLADCSGWGGSAGLEHWTPELAANHPWSCSDARSWFTWCLGVILVYGRHADGTDGARWLFWDKAWLPFDPFIHHCLWLRRALDHSERKERSPTRYTRRGSGNRDQGAGFCDMGERESRRLIARPSGPVHSADRRTYRVRIGVRRTYDMRWCSEGTDRAQGRTE